MNTIVSKKSLGKLKTALKAGHVLFILTFFGGAFVFKGNQAVSNILIITGIVFSITCSVLDIIVYNKKKVLVAAQRSERTSE